MRASRASWALATVLAACQPEPGDPGEGLGTCTIEAPAAGPLHSDGTTIRDASGRLTSLRGVNTGGRSKFAPYLPFEYNEDFDGALAIYMDRAGTWGMTTLRVPFNWAALEPTEGTWDEAWLVHYTALLDAAGERELSVIVDFHQDIYGEFYCGDGFPGWTVADPPENHHDCPDWFTGYLSDPDVAAAFDAFWADTGGVQTKYRAMWSELATRLADHPAVVGYEVFNEPGWGSANRADWAASTLTPFYSDMAGLVAAADPDALFLFDATGLDAVTWATGLGRPEGDNLVFAPHFYDPVVIAGGGEPSADVADALGIWADKGAEWAVPVLIGEYGVDPDVDGAVGYAQDHYTAFDALGLHGTWWQYSVSWEQWNAEDLDLVTGDGHERDELVDVLARPVPRFVAGDDVVVSYTGGILRLEFVATPGGVTEITLPTRIATDGGWPGATAALVRGEGGCVDRRDDRLYLRSEEGGAVWVEVGR